MISIQHVNLASGNDLPACPNSGSGLDMPFTSGSSMYDDVTDKVGGSFGGVYAHISPTPTCRDSNSNPATSSWVMLQAGGGSYSGCGNKTEVFVQAGIFYSYPASKPHSEHAFAEVDYPCLTGNGTHEFFSRRLTSGTFAVEDLGRSTDHGNCPGLYFKEGRSRIPMLAGGDDADHVVDRVVTTLNGKCLWVMDLPARYSGLFHWADLSEEVHNYTSRLPGTYEHRLVFSDAHVYYDQKWENFTSNGRRTLGNPPPSSAPKQVSVDLASGGEGTGCQLDSPSAGANWHVYMWSSGGYCDPYSGRVEALPLY